MFNVIFSAFREKKKYIISLLLFLITYLIFLILLSIYNYYSNNINLLQNEPINRGIEVYTNDINNIVTNDIEMYYPIFPNQTIKKDSKYYDLNSWNEESNLILGKKPETKAEIVISKNLFTLLKLKEDDYQQTLTLSINDNLYKFNIVGITNNIKADIYLDELSFQSIFDIKPNKYYVLINSYKNVNKFINNLMNQGISASLYDATMQVQIDSMKNMQNMYTYIMIAIIIVIFLFLIVIIKNNIQYENKNIAIFKAFGYRSIKILYIILMRLVFISLLAYTIIQLLTSVIFLILRKFIETYNLSLINLFTYNTITMFIIMGLIFINVFIYKKKVVKMNAIEVLQDF